MIRTRSLLGRHVAPSLPPAILVTLTLAFATLTVMRGLDYAAADAPAGGSLVMLDVWFGLRFWGWLLVVAGGLLWVAYVVRLHFGVFLAHVVAGAIYFGVVAAVIGAYRADLGEGWAPIIAPAGAVAWHTLMAAITKPFPPAATDAD